MRRRFIFAAVSRGFIRRMCAPSGTATVWVHFLIVKVIGPLHVSAELRIIFVRRQHKRCAAAPAAHELCCDELLLLRRLSMLSKKIAERAHMLLQAPIGHVAPIPR